MPVETVSILNFYFEPTFFSSLNNKHHISEGWTRFVYENLYVENHIFTAYTLYVCFGIPLELFP